MVLVVTEKLSIMARRSLRPCNGSSRTGQVAAIVTAELEGFHDDGFVCRSCTSAVVRTFVSQRNASMIRTTLTSIAVLILVFAWGRIALSQERIWHPYVEMEGRAGSLREIGQGNLFLPLWQ